MRIIVCGGRTYGNVVLIAQTLIDYHPNDPTPTLITSGHPTGAGAIAAIIARGWGWTTEKSTLPHTNMNADVCLVFPGGEGTAAIESSARRHGIPVTRIRDDTTTYVICAGTTPS